MGCFVCFVYCFFVVVVVVVLVVVAVVVVVVAGVVVVVVAGVVVVDVAGGRISKSHVVSMRLNSGGRLTFFCFGLFSHFMASIFITFLLLTVHCDLQVTFKRIKNCRSIR